MREPHQNTTTTVQGTPTGPRIDEERPWLGALETRERVVRLLSNERGREYISRVFGRIADDIEAAQSGELNLLLPKAKRAKAKMSDVQVMHALIDLSLTGEVYYWAPELVETLSNTFESLPPTTLTADLLPSPYGFAVMDGAVPIPPFRDVGGEVVNDDLLAFSWSTVESKGRFAGAFIVYYTRPAPDLTPVPSPTTIFFWPAGETTTKMEAEHQDRAEDRLELPRVRKRLAIAADAWLFLRERVLVHSNRQPGRAGRRRLERANPELPTEVKVVELRRREYVRRGESEPVDVEWTCRWIVQGHWRSQYYPSTGEHRPRWIRPYVKGPDDMPLRVPRAVVNTVVR